MIKLVGIIASKKLTGKPSFSTQNRDLIQKAYPYSEVKELRRLCGLVDRYVEKKQENHLRAFDFLQGRAFGFWGTIGDVGPSDSCIVAAR